MPSRRALCSPPSSGDPPTPQKIPLIVEEQARIYCGSQPSYQAEPNRTPLNYRDAMSRAEVEKGRKVMARA